MLSGGNTMFPGFAERVSKELTAMAPASMASAVTVVGGKSRFGAWVGGSLLASLPTFQPMWVTREAYVKEGPAVVHHMCG